MAVAKYASTWMSGAQAIELPANHKMKVTAKEKEQAAIAAAKQAAKQSAAAEVAKKAAETGKAVSELQRAFQKSWVTDVDGNPHLEYDETSGFMYCKLCHTQPTQGSSSMRKDRVTEHVRSQTHIAALKRLDAGPQRTMPAAVIDMEDAAHPAEPEYAVKLRVMAWLLDRGAPFD